MKGNEAVLEYGGLKAGVHADWHCTGLACGVWGMWLCPADPAFSLGG